MLKKYRSTALAVSVITAMACLKYALFQGGELRPVSLAPQRAAVKQDAGAELVYADDSFQLYFFQDQLSVSGLYIDFFFCYFCYCAGQYLLIFLICFCFPYFQRPAFQHSICAGPGI